MRFASAISQSGNGGLAVQELIAQVGGQLEPSAVDFVLFHSTAHFEDEIDEVLASLEGRFRNAFLLGCTAEGTIGSDREAQRGCSVALLAGSLPDVGLRPFHIEQEQLESTESPDAWRDLLGADTEETRLIVAMGDPFTFHAGGFLEKTNQTLPGVPIVGGMASAAEQPGQNRLFFGGQTFRHGLSGVAMSGDLSIRTVVSQGCRPIGNPFVVTKGEQNVIRELGGHPALEQLTTVVKSLSERDVALARQSLFVGRVIDEYRESFGRGDFLIQNIIGFDPAGGALGIAAPVRVGSTVQFHVRDADSADQDLRTLLSGLAPSCAEVPPAAAMLFSCNGRGIRMWPDEGHDVSVLRELCGQIPVAGFFAAGEIGPIGGRNFMHGFTASIALISPR